MADTFQTVIDTAARPDEADHLARHVVEFLAGKGVIEAVASQEGGYVRGPGALEIAEAGETRRAHETIPPVYSHLQVIIGRATHCADLSDPRPPKPLCPACGSPLVDQEDELWSEALQGWLSGDDEAYLACVVGQDGGPITTWDYQGTFGFGNLAFRFWNWPPLKPSFLDELRKELGHPIAIVRGKL